MKELKTQFIKLNVYVIHVFFFFVVGEGKGGWGCCENNKS